MDKPSPSPTTDTETRKPAGKRLGRRIALALAALALVGGAGYGYYWYVTGRFIQSTDNAYLRADQVSMAPQVAGQVTEIYVRDNQDVAAGQPLVKIDPQRYEMAARQARATVDARQADLAKAEADLRQQDLVIAQAQADLENAEANADLAQKQAARIAPLVARGVESQQKSEEAEAARKQADSVTRLKQAVLDGDRQQLAGLTAAVQQARAQLEAAQESLNQAEDDLSRTLLRSPIDGRVGDRTVRLGQYVQPGTLLLTVVPMDRLYLVANFKETQIGAMRAGQTARISVDAYPGLKIGGVVDSFSPGTGAQFALLPPENATGNFTKIVQRVPVRIRLDKESGLPPLVPGLSIEVAVDTKATPSGPVALK